MAGVYVYDLNVVPSMSDNDYFLINQGDKLVRLQKSVLIKLLNVLTTEQTEKIETIKIDEDGKLFLDNAGKYRTVTLDDISDLNDGVDDIINAFTVDDDGQLLFNGQSLGGEGGSVYELPVASTDTLGGVKVDGSTITIDENGVISGASAYELPVASDAVLGGIKIDNDTIKINEGVISADVIGNWSAGISYPVGYFVVYDNALYQCITANSNEVWTESNWTPIGSKSSETGMTIDNWVANTEYAVGNLVINETTIYQCNTEHTSGDVFDSTNWTAMTGEKGDKGEDGFSPIAKVVATETGATITITDATETTTVDISNGTDGTTPHIDDTTKHWFIGEEDTGIVAEGVNGISPIASIEQTETGAIVTVTSGEETITAELTNGITPHIDETTKHWMIGDIDTGIAAEGVTTIATQKFDISTTLLAEGWSTTVPYEQTVQVSEINATLNPRIDVIISDNVVTGQKEEISFSYLTKVVTGDGFITAYCYEKKPTVDLNILIEVI